MVLIKSLAFINTIMKMNVCLVFVMLLVSAFAENDDNTMLAEQSICGLPWDEPKIIGGTITKLGAYPWMAALEYKLKITGENGGIRAGGSLINKRYILTAAHVILDDEFELISVWLGEWRISTDPDCIELLANRDCADPVQKFNISETIRHPFFISRFRTNNIGLIRLEKEVTYSDYIRPICLSSNSLPILEPGTLLTVVGWGVTENGTSSDVKLEVKVPFVSLEICQEKLRHVTALRFNLKNMCAGGEIEIGKSCQGDSGQALLRIYKNESGEIQWYQEGIVAWGIGCGRVGYPAVYTRVASYYNWIKTAISNDE